MPRFVVVAQARADSSRLPGKVLMPAGGMPVLAQVVRRAKAIPGVNAVCLATSDRPVDDPVAAAGEAAGAVVFRGSADDVLSRYAGAAEKLQADTVMRLTCDCPLLDPQLCGEVAALRERAEADYASNVEPPLWPHGLDCEIFTRAALELAQASAVDAADREHVTLWLRHAPTVRRAHLPGPGGELAMQRWTLDYPEDYALVKHVLDAFSSSREIPDWRAVMAYLRDHPDVAGLNAMRRDPARARMPS